MLESYADRYRSDWSSISAPGRFLKWSHFQADFRYSPTSGTRLLFMCDGCYRPYPEFGTKDEQSCANLPAL